MRGHPGHQGRLVSLLAVCLLSCAAGLNIAPARAQDAPSVSSVAPAATAARPRVARTVRHRRSAHRRVRPQVRPEHAGQYFIEFRSRYALSYGHTFLVHGRLNAKGEIGPLTADNVAGFHPAGAGSEFWTMGHVVPVPSETGPSDGDLEEEYVSARYRVLLTEAEYARAYARIKQMQANRVPWHAVLYNCSAWVGDVARYMGLKAPVNHLLFPANYINEMKRLNGGRDRLTPNTTASLTPAR